MNQTDLDKNPRWNSLYLCQDLGITFSDEPTLAPAATTARSNMLDSCSAKIYPLVNSHNYGKIRHF